MISLHFPKFPFRIREEGGLQYIQDFIRRRYVRLTPEEWVRQNLLHYFVRECGYPRGLFSVEKEIIVNSLRKRYDIVLYDRYQKPWMLVECKEPGVSIGDHTLQQLLSYHQVVQCPYWVLSNGHSTFCAHVCDGRVRWLSQLPSYEF